MGIVQSRKSNKQSPLHRLTAVKATAADPTTISTTTSSSALQRNNHSRDSRVTLKRRGKSLESGEDVRAVEAGTMAERHSGNAAGSNRPDEDTPMQDGALAGTSSMPPAIDYARRRRTRSVAQQSAASDEAQPNDSDESGPRRVRRRTQGKRRADEEQVADGGQKALAEPLALDVQNETQRTQHSSSALPLAGAATPADQTAGGSQHGASASTFNEAPQVNQSTATDTADSEPSQDAPTTDRTDDDRRAQVRRQIAQAVRSGIAPSRFAAMQEMRSSEGTQPSILSAMLSDILGLRGASRTANANGDGAGETAPVQGQSAPTSTGLGGTSVIVQGALVTRTIPSRNTAPSSATGRRQGVGHDAVATDQAAGGSSSDDSLFEPNGAADDVGDAQAATIEEQAGMLVRLMSIATAATAASLLQVSANRQAAAAQAASAAGTAQTGSSEGGDMSVAVDESGASSIPTSADAASSSSMQPGSSTHSAQQSSPSTSEDNSNSSVWSSQTLQSLRSRIQSLGNRLRGRRSSVHSQWPPRVAYNPSASTSTASNRADFHVPSDDPQTAAASTLSALSNMLRDAIRDGLHGNGANGGGEGGAQSTSAMQGESTTPSGSPAQASSAQSRVQSVNATLEAVRAGQLTRGEEGTFNRFLFDTASDLNFAVRRGDEDEVGASASASSEATSSDEAGARRQGDSNDGQLSFFRFFSFPSSQGHALDGVGGTNLMPCIVIGVRSMRPSAAPAPAATASTADGAPQMPATAASQAEQDRAQGAQQNNATFAAENLLYDGSDAPNLSRYLLFVSGGHFAAHHPLFHSSPEESSRDLMVLMEFLGAMAAVQAKPSNTVTRDEIARSSLRAVNGSRTEIETLAGLQQVMENTSERCLICLEDWLDEPEERRLLDCGHLFHAPCLDQWLVSSNNSCPLCRRQAVAPSSEASV